MKPHAQQNAGDFLLREAASASRVDQFSAGLTGIRALAALMVLAHHIFALAGPRFLAFDVGGLEISYHWLITCSWMGANVFFVLSGFLLAIPFCRHIEGQGDRVATGAYLWRRIRRVVPAYWVQIVILCIVLYCTSGLPPLWVIATQFLFLQDFWHGYEGALNGVYWTLPIEFGYYLILPLLAMFVALFSSRQRMVWLAVCVLLVASAIAYRSLMYIQVADQPQPIKFFLLMQLPGLIDHFAIGMLLAWVYVRLGSSIKGWMSDLLVVAGLGGIIFMMAMVDNHYRAYWNGHPMLLYGYTITAFFIGVLVLGTATAGKLSRILFASKPMLFIGIVSYSLYLWHYPILHWLIAWFDYLGIAGDRLWWLTGMGIPLSLLAAIASYWLIERPFLTRKAHP